MNVVREVAVILDLTRDYDRKIAAGVSHYVQEVKDWRIYLEVDPVNRLPDFRDWRGHGIIADVDDAEALRAVLGRAAPCVGIGRASSTSEVIRRRIAYVATD